MVKICPNEYPREKEEQYAEYFGAYPFPLSTFQKFAIEAIVEGQHSLSCVPTGSGKTMPALFAIDYFTKKGKKVIYTSPIKALSNQKYHEFTTKFPEIRIGLLTGDIKINPEAQVLIMTAEILQNTLYIKKQQEGQGSNSTSLLTFDMNFEEELGCVIQDEIHMINDTERGHVWESIILLLPPSIQMVMLSATLDKPELFAQWVETRGNQKQVYLTTSTFRHVPLTHYSFITCNESIYKSVKKDASLEKQIRSTVNTLHVLQSPTGEFQEQNYHKVKKMLSFFEEKQLYVKRGHVLNQVCKYMVEHSMLPAVCFILSRKQIESACREITTPLLEDDSKVGYTVKRECEQLLRRKLPNVQEYLELPEYQDMVSLLEKGIAIHHSGIMSILREIVEILFEKGYIKLLFATETFSVGLNMPIKTALFTDVKKFDGSVRRMLYPHEYNQASGRAGRRGLDTVGHVIHLSNLFRDIELPEYRTMMQGRSQTLVSKFKISYHLLLNLIGIGNHEYVEFCKRAMIQNEIDARISVLQESLALEKGKMEKQEDRLQYLRTPKEIVQRYVDLLARRTTVVNKKRKDIEKEIQTICDEYTWIESDKKILLSYEEKASEVGSIEGELHHMDSFLQRSVQIILERMVEKGCITEDSVERRYQLTLPGSIACQLREVHGLVFADLIYRNIFDSFTAMQLISIFSCFTNCVVQDEKKSYFPSKHDRKVASLVTMIAKEYEEYHQYEIQHSMFTGIDYTIHYDLMDCMNAWSECSRADECKQVVQQLELCKGIFLGEFVKAITKINNISAEMEMVAESIGNISLLSVLQEIPAFTLKFVATNQSLYV